MSTRNVMILILLTAALSGCVSEEQDGMKPLDDSLMIEETPEDSIVDELDDIVVIGTDSVVIIKCDSDADCERCSDNSIYTQECISGTCQGPFDLVKHCAEDEQCVVGETNAYCELVLEALPVVCIYCSLNSDGDLVVETLDIQGEQFPKDMFRQIPYNGGTYWEVDDTNPNNKIIDAQTVMAKGIPLASIKNPEDVLDNPNPALKGNYSAFTEIPYRTLDPKREVGEYEGRKDVVITVEEWNRLFSSY